MHDPTPPKSDSKLLREGTRGTDVRTVQSALDRLGAHLVVDGIFGPATDKAVRQFQTAHHLASDGIVGPMTWGALNTALASADPNPSSHATRSVKHWSAENDQDVVNLIHKALRTHGGNVQFAFIDLRDQRQQPANYYNTDLAIAADYMRARWETQKHGFVAAESEVDGYLALKQRALSPSKVLAPYRPTRSGKPTSCTLVSLTKRANSPQ